MPHGFRVGRAANRKLNLYTLAAMVGYFDELSDSIQKGIVEPGELSDIATRHAMEVLGPAPEGYV